MGPDKLYLPAESVSYALVCFLSGELPIRAHMEQRGASARFLEVVLNEPIFPAGDLDTWWDRAKSHWGWYGRDLVERVIERYFANGRNGHPLQGMYSYFRAGFARLYQDHSRMLDFLALTQLGYYLATTLLFHGFGCIRPSLHEKVTRKSKRFACEVYERLNRGTKLDQVIAAICVIEGIGRWVEKGFIPLESLEGIATDFGMAEKGRLGRFLINQGVVTKSEPRKLDGGGSARCYVLSAEGKQRLSVSSTTT